MFNASCTVSLAQKMKLQDVRKILSEPIICTGFTPFCSFQMKTRGNLYSPKFLLKYTLLTTFNAYAFTKSFLIN